MDFVSEWLASLGLTSYAPWFQGNGIDSQDNLVDLAQKSAADVDKKVQVLQCCLTMLPKFAFYLFRLRVALTNTSLALESAHSRNE